MIILTRVAPAQQELIYANESFSPSSNRQPYVASTGNYPFDNPDLLAYI